MPTNPFEPPKELGTPTDPVAWLRVLRVVAITLCVALFLGAIAFMLAIGVWELDGE